MCACYYFEITYKDLKLQIKSMIHSLNSLTLCSMCTIGSLISKSCFIPIKTYYLLWDWESQLPKERTSRLTLRIQRSNVLHVI